MNIYVGNLSRTVTEEALRNAFEQFGEVSSVKIMTDRITREPRGFGFIEMPNADEAEQAIAQLNGQELDGQRLRVNEARPQEEGAGARRRPGGSGMGNGGGGMGGGGRSFGGGSRGGPRSSGSSNGNGWRRP
jgi:RNA recognition motif-containing protein